MWEGSELHVEGPATEHSLLASFMLVQGTTKWHETLIANGHHCKCYTSPLKAKFYYAIQLATSSRADLRPGRELVCKLLASCTKTCVCVSCACRSPNSITLSSSLAGSRASLRPASELDGVMEFGLKYEGADV